MCYIITIIGGGYSEYTQCVTLLPSLVEGTGIQTMCYIITIIGGGYGGYTQCVTPLPS